MLIFNEGVPGAGKSYDAVVEHIVPALKSGRRVFARLNGLNDEKLAEFCGVPVGTVRELLVRVSSDKVAAYFVAEREEREGESEYVIPEQFRNALIVIDEVHEFYVSSRDPLPKEVEQFFAVHRHYGVDIVLITQWYKRLHTAVRARIERKNVFQKLTAVGMENSYRVTFWSTVAPDKYEKVGGVTRKYDHAAFALYRGVADEAVQTDVYKGGSRTVWAELKWPAVIVGVLTVVALVMLIRFFTGGVSMFKAEPKEPESASAPPQQGEFFQPSDPPEVHPAPAVQVVAENPDRYRKLTPIQRYVVELAESGRARTSAMIGDGSEAWGVVEFRPANKPPVEVLTTRQLQAMGFTVRAEPYGFILEAGESTIVATQWPTHEVVRSNNHELYRLDRNPAGPGAPASEASGTARTTAPLGSRTDPASVGSPAQGSVWGKMPETVTASGF